MFKYFVGFFFGIGNVIGCGCLFFLVFLMLGFFFLLLCFFDLFLILSLFCLVEDFVNKD